jgi:hypothetical protein
MKGPSSSIPTERLSEGWSGGVTLHEVLPNRGLVPGPFWGGGGYRGEISCMHPDPSPDALGPGLPESMLRSILSAMWKESYGRKGDPLVTDP